MTASLVACSTDNRTGGSSVLPQGVQTVSSTSSTPLSVPVFTSGFVYQGTSYPFTIVGSDPMTAPASTTVNVAVVPLRLTFANGTVLDASPAVRYLPKSPLFTTSSYPAGTTQYGDALMRSEFWSYIGNGAKDYHVLLGTPAIEATVPLAVPSPDGYATGTGSTAQGYMTFPWFVKSQEKEIIDRLGIPPSSLTIFATVKTRVLEPTDTPGKYYCCFAGYHYKFPVSTPQGTEIWTTAWASIASSSVETLSHEIAEWLNDPYYDNFVPKWKLPESGACGGDVMEVGDPVTNYHFYANGFGVQDETFYSWFSRQNPSAGIDGWYDLMHELSGPAVTC